MGLKSEEFNANFSSGRISDGKLDDPEEVQVSPPFRDEIRLLGGSAGAMMGARGRMGLTTFVFNRAIDLAFFSASSEAMANLERAFLQYICATR
jgi:hypothetical protein